MALKTCSTVFPGTVIKSVASKDHPSCRGMWHFCLSIVIGALLKLPWPFKGVWEWHLGGAGQQSYLSCEPTGPDSSIRQRNQKGLRANLTRRAFSASVTSKSPSPLSHRTMFSLKLLLLTLYQEKLLLLPLAWFFLLGSFSLPRTIPIYLGNVPVSLYPSTFNKPPPTSTHEYPWLR